GEVQAIGGIVAACLTAQAGQPSIEVVQAGQTWRNAVRDIKATERNGQIALAVALDVAVALEGHDAARRTEPSDRAGQVERFARGACADLGATFGQQAPQFSERHWLCPQRHPLFSACTFVGVGSTCIASALCAYRERRRGARLF